MFLSLCVFGSAASEIEFALWQLESSCERESGDVESWAVANALMGVQRVLIAYVRSSVLAGKRGESLAADTRSAGEPAFAALERGLRDYAVKGSVDEQVIPE